MKKIAHIISSLKRGGAESLLVDLLADLGHYEHHVIFFHDGPNRERLHELGIKTYQVKGLLFLYDPIFFIRLYQLVKLLKPDCMHTALWIANFAGRIIAKMLAIPLVSVIHLGIHQDGKIRNILDSFTFGLSQKIIAVSDEVAESLEEKNWVPASSITVIKNGISKERVLRQATKDPLTRQELGIADDAFVIGSVGRFIARKNFELLLDAFADVAPKIPHAVLVLVGFGPLEQILRKRAFDLGIDRKVHFVVGRSAYGCYPLFDCFVLPSLQEGLSIALLEALCFGLPVIVTGFNGLHEVITTGKEGYVINAGNKEQLSEKILALADNGCRASMKSASLDLVETRFSMKSMSKHYDNFFGQL
ncbi:MAG: glycosyltransferase [Candidatus Babeliales bacterium]